MLAIGHLWVLFRDLVTGEGRKQQISLNTVLDKYRHKDEVYRKIRDMLNTEMERGLSKTQNKDATVKMFITYVESLPDGSETGDYLALDLGGTNFRVLLITLKGSEVEMKNKIYPISQELMTGRGELLFDHIAGCIANFMKEHNLMHKPLPLGFTFSFPCKQEGLAVGRLAHWTKGFCCAGVEGQDVVRLLHEAIGRRKDIEVECVALLNDTVGCLMSCAFLDHNTRVGVILGTGTNACYMEKLERVGMWDGERSRDHNQVIINTEWGAFGDNGCLDFVRTVSDRNIDVESINPGKQIYEKMISGMYMGEIARQVILECAAEHLLFKGVLSDEFKEAHRFHTKYVSEIETDVMKSSNDKTRQILDEMGISDPTLEDCQGVQQVCRVVSERAAFLASAGIAALLNRIHLPDVTVAVDGSLYRFHPHFHNLMMKKTTELLNAGIKVKMMLSEDGSGKGAALVAAVAHRVNTARRSISSES